MSGVAGWPGYVFEDVEIALREGRPALTGFRIRYAGEGDAPTLTAERLARVPAAKLAAAVASLPGGDYMAGDVTARLLQAFAALAEPAPLPERPRGGSPEFHRAVLAVYQSARAEGRSGIAAIAAAAGVGRDRAKQYSAEANRWARAHTTEPVRPAGDAADPGARDTTKPVRQMDAADAAALAELTKGRRTGRSPGRGSTARRHDDTKGSR